MIILSIIGLTLLSGSCILLGGLIASQGNLRPNWLEKELRHFIIALGGGVMLGAVSQVLVPEGIAGTDHAAWGIPVLLCGGITFFVIERILGLQRREAPQLMGMMLDYIPEALALGGMVAIGSPVAPLLAMLIGLQNLPEGFNAYRELVAQNHQHGRRTLITMALLTLLGPVAGLAGYFVLDSRPALLGGIMLFASGGILYLIFQDIAPQSKLRRHWAPPLGAVAGFCIALYSERLLTSYAP